MIGRHVASPRGSLRPFAVVALCLGCVPEPEGAAAACVGGRCGPRCYASGIADPTSLFAHFESYTERSCRAVPIELLDPRYPGTYHGGTSPIGQVHCEGFRPGPATLEFTYRVRLLEARHAVDLCFCSGAWDVQMPVVVNDTQVTPLHEHGRNDDDESCRYGPDGTQRIPAEVRADGTLDARVELSWCMRGRDTDCLFLQGTALRLTQ